MTECQLRGTKDKKRELIPHLVTLSSRANIQALQKQGEQITI